MYFLPHIGNESEKIILVRIYVPLVERIIEVKIKTSELTTERGLIAVYEKLKTKANRECRADRRTLKHLNQTMDQCSQDLVGQFVESSKIKILQDYHQAETSTDTQTLAMNMATSLQN